MANTQKQARSHTRTSPADPTETTSLAVLVRSRREQLHLTQEQLALRVQVSRSEISEIEAGRVRQPRAHAFARLGRALGLPAAALLGALGYASGEAASVDAEDLMLMATALVQVAGAERSWLRERLSELGDLLVARQSSRGLSPSRGSARARNRAARGSRTLIATARSADAR